MTSLAFILGVLPLVFATGAGAVARRTIGFTVLGGMLAAIDPGDIYCACSFCADHPFFLWKGKTWPGSGSTTRN